MRDVFAYFHDGPGSPLDKAAYSIMEARGGRPIGAGTDMITGKRDVQFRFEDAAADDVVVALKKAGFEAESSPA